MSDTDKEIEPRIAAVPAVATGAVLVAVETYTQAGWNLTGPLNGAVEFAEWLGSRRVPGAHIHMLVSASAERLAEVAPRLNQLGIPAPEEATQANIREAFIAGLENAPYELVFVYWSGHGSLTADKRHHLLTSDARYKDVLTHEVGRLESFLKTDQAGATADALGHQVFFFDVCSDYAELSAIEELAAKMSPGTFPTAGKPVAERGQFVVRATGLGAKAENFEHRGVFSRELLKFLNQQPAGSWPEPMACVRGVEKALAEWHKTGVTFQIPIFNGQDWSGSDLPAFGGERFARIRTDQIERLRETFAGWPVPPDAVLIQAFAAARRVNVKPPAQSGLDLWHACLMELAESANPSIFFRFLLLCKTFTPHAKQKKALQQWMDAARCKAGFSEREWKTVQAEAKNLVKKFPKVWPADDVLQMVLRPVPSLKGTPSYQLHWGIYRRNPNTSEYKGADAKNFGADEVEAAVSALLPGACRQLPNTPARLDFILPYRLFHLPLEQRKAVWGVASELSMGIRFATGRRFFERAYPEEVLSANPSWDLPPVLATQRKKWTAFSEGFTAKTQLRWAGSFDAFLEAAAAALSPADMTAVLVAATLESASHLPADVFAKMLDSGVPVAVWLHQSTASADEAWEKLEKIFNEPATEWPAQTRQFREKPPVACQNIVLLWDNPLEPLPMLPTFENAPMGQSI